MAKQSPSPEAEALWIEANKARRCSHSPYSHFAVGAALETEEGEVFRGCNVENASYGGTVCAERVAILKAVSEGHKRFERLVVVGDLSKPTAPCALCLQTLAEFCSPNFEIWLGTGDELKWRYKFGDLLPMPFGPAELLGPDAPARASSSQSSRKARPASKKRRQSR
jgi:cytidine deaminase